MKFGVSFSIRQCRNFQIYATKTLNWLVENVGFTRFRLMSYWNEHENIQGGHDFKELNKQIKRIEDADGEITFCLGARQPR